MDLGKAIDAAKKFGGKPLSDILFDRLRNNFYGYILTSLILFNLENIILVFKSKDSIELTLIYIGLQKNFVWNFFWKPILWGIGAAIVMPIITAIYALIVGVIIAIRDDSGTVGADLWEAFKNTCQAKRDAASIEKNEIEAKIERLTTQHRAAELRIIELNERRDNFEDYLLKLVHLYGSYRNNTYHRDLAGFTKAIEDNDIAKYFPSPTLLKDMMAFIKKETTETEKIEEDLGTDTDDFSEIHREIKQSK